jgi:hypothetical protein
MIEALSNVGVRAVPTVATMDMGLQYDFITPRGAGTYFGGMDAWPLWRCSPINEKKWNEVVKAIQAGKVTDDTLHGTGLDIMLGFVQTLEEVDYAILLRELPVLNRPETDFYCLFDVGEWYEPNSMVEFYIDEAEALRAFSDRYCIRPDSWLDMSDEEIITWHERLSGDLERMIYAIPSEEAQ